MAVGAVSFLLGLGFLALLPTVGGPPEEELFEINLLVGSAAVLTILGGVLVVQAASALGGTGSRAMGLRTPWWLVPLFIAGLGAGQWQVNHPERLPWLFPLSNLAVVSGPSLLIAVMVARRYLRANPLAWPLSWREAASGFIYGAVGATNVAAVINTLYLGIAGALLVSQFGRGDTFPLEDSLRTLPTGWGLFFDLSVLSVVAPLNEEFWKGMLVAFFFFRRGGAGRCFLWGVLAGTGFNLLETFSNSLAVVSPEAVAEQTIGSQWWLFALARAGTSAIHGLASGLSALGIYGLLRRRWRFAPGYLAGISVHGAWNFLSYALGGDQFLSAAGPDSRALDVLSIVGMSALVAGCLVLLWVLPGRVRDERPAPIYGALGMAPARDPSAGRRW